MATSTGKKARKRYGNRFAAKQRRDSGTKAKKSRKRFGTLPFSVSAKNAPEGAVRANEELVHRINEAKAARSFEPEDNVAVGDGFSRTRAQVDAEQAAIREAARKARAKARKAADLEDEDEDEDFEERF